MSPLSHGELWLTREQIYPSRDRQGVAGDDGVSRQGDGGSEEIAVKRFGFIVSRSEKEGRARNDKRASPT
jgi:hypothetical protein